MYMKNHILLNIKVSFPFPCSVGSFFHCPHVVLSFCTVQLLFKTFSWICKWMATLYAQLCPEIVLCLQTVFMGMKWEFSFPNSMTLAWNMSGMWIFNSDLLQTPDTGTLHLGRPHCPGFGCLTPSLSYCYSMLIYCFPGNSSFLLVVEEK